MRFICWLIIAFTQGYAITVLDRFTTQNMISDTAVLLLCIFMLVNLLVGYILGRSSTPKI